ncbi:MAG: hypothetical protein PVH99_16310, partial [Desulfobacteraceae bacterium]
QGIISPPRRDLRSGVAFDRSSLRRIAPYASVVAPRRLASNTLLVLRNPPKLTEFSEKRRI